MRQASGMLTSRFALPLLALFASAPMARAEAVDLVRVDKSERLLELLSGDKVVRSYAVALGANPVGHKRQEGDERTPEGRYVLDWRNPGSAFTKSIHISYPDADDKAAAKRAGVDPGGMIMIHGQSKGFGWWSWLMQMFDWTNGCIAVTDEDMAEIWKMVENGTPIEINP
ncbi:murein L,D-transpeptidase YafK [Aminobacter aganoensis]|uniref:Murein L,D-transpeptidase YafK n=2 Tax=Aminobacter aganoensis TaxID=83264 RepID=A0A7X0F5Q6_9HYPH|nr:murein L,D-transpeptidase YafK [Aminobacter aganoensis]